MPEILFSLRVSQGERVRAFFRRSTHWPAVPAIGERVATGWEAQPEAPVEEVVWRRDGSAAVTLAALEGGDGVERAREALQEAGWSMSPMPGTSTELDA